MDEEVWKDVPSVPGYMASSHGRIMCKPFFSEASKRMYYGKPWTGTWVEKDERFVTKIRGKNLKVHRMVCEAFNGPPPFDGAVVMHDDENPANNRSDNLKWGTQKENLNYPGFLDKRSGLSKKLWLEFKDSKAYTDRGTTRLVKASEMNVT